MTLTDENLSPPQGLRLCGARRLAERSPGPASAPGAGTGGRATGCRGCPVPSDRPVGGACTFRLTAPAAANRRVSAVASEYPSSARDGPHVRRACATGPKIIARPGKARRGRSPTAPKPGCRVDPAGGRLAMEIHSPDLPVTLEPA